MSATRVPISSRSEEAFRNWQSIRHLREVTNIIELWKTMASSSKRITSGELTEVSRLAERSAISSTSSTWSLSQKPTAHRFKPMTTSSSCRLMVFFLYSPRTSLLRWSQSIDFKDSLLIRWPLESWTIVVTAPRNGRLEAKKIQPPKEDILEVLKSRTAETTCLWCWLTSKNTTLTTKSCSPGKTPALVSVWPLVLAVNRVDLTLTSRGDTTLKLELDHGNSHKMSHALLSACLASSKRIDLWSRAAPTLQNCLRITKHLAKYLLLQYKRRWGLPKQGIA